jgi:hypothetical protein
MKYNRTDLGVALHTALRKACDSDPTTAAWVAINRMPKEQWVRYLDHVHAALEAAPDDKAPVEALKEASLGWLPDQAQAATFERSLKTAFFSFNESDWEGYGCWLDEVRL